MKDDPQQPKQEAKASYWLPNDVRWSAPKFASFNPKKLNSHARPRRLASLTGPAGEPLYLN